MKINKVLIVLLLFVCSFLFTSSAFAATQYVTLVGDTVRVRKGPGTNYDKWGNVSIGATFDLVDSTVYPDESTSSDNKCDAGWHKIQYASDKIGYICKSYVQVSDYIIIDEEAKTNCENELKNLNFPASYWEGLCSLKALHPKWSFVPIQTGLDWKYVIEKESTCGKSLLQTTNSEYIDSTCNKGYGSWEAASKKAVSYYMDPRNFFTEKYIFQFEYLKYSTSLSDAYISSSNSMLASASFFKYHNNLGNNMGSIINTAGKETNVNPVFLSARMLQELGTSDTLYNLYSGVYTGYDGLYKGYYNFYNMGVTDSCATTSGTSYCGLSYAYKKGWNSPLNAIKGGSELLANSYISVGQYNTYLQKFNVVPTKISNLFLHQYMTNIKAPSGESSSTYNTYKKLGLLDNNYEFHIPVYTNMDATIDNSGSGATGEDDDDVVTSLSVATVVTSAGYKMSGNSILGITLGKSLDSIKSELESISGKNTVTITDAKGNNYTGKIATGIKIKIKTNSETKELSVVIKGDTSGDGVINALDLLQVQKNILGSYDLKDSYKLAGDTSGDGVINALDLLQVQKNILGSYEIK